MSKYGELSVTALDTIRLFDALQTMIIQTFTEKLSNAWGCTKECISFEFDNPCYTNRNKIMSWDFTVCIEIIIPTYQKVTFSLPGFSAYTIKDSGAISPITIKYHDKMYKTDELGGDLSDSIFQEIQKKIEQGSWVQDTASTLPPRVIINRN